MKTARKKPIRQRCRPAVELLETRDLPSSFTVGNLVVELGVVGLVLWVVLGFFVAISGWKVVAQLRATPWFPLAFAIWLFAIILIFPMMFTGVAPYQDFVLNSDLWLLLGILFRLKLFPQAHQVAQVQTVSGRG